MNLEQTLNEIKNRCDAASDKYELESDDFIRLHKPSPYTGKIVPSNGLRIGPNDAVFIAHARTDVPMLLEMAEMLNEIVYCPLHHMLDWNKYKQRLEKIAEKYK